MSSNHVIEKFKNHNRRRCERYLSRLTLLVTTFGSDEVFEVMTLNISETGTLVGSATTPPFKLNTIIEGRVDPKSAGLDDEPLYFVGRVVRVAKHDETAVADFKSQYGVDANLRSIFGFELNDMPEKDINLWINLVAKAESDAQARA